MIRRLLISCVAAFFAAPAAVGQTITFDNLPTPTLGTFPSFVPNGYETFDWTNFVYLNETVASSTPMPFPNDSVSQPNWAITAAPTISFSHSTPFTLVSAYIAAIGTSSSQMIVEGLNGGTVVDTSTITLGSTPTRFTFDFAHITEVELVGVPQGGVTFLSGLDNIDVIVAGTGGGGAGGSSSFASVPGLNGNQSGIATSIDNGHAGASLGKVTTALIALPVSSLPGALDQLSPVKFNNFASTTAFNNETFEVEEMDSYLAGLRNGPGGTFLGGNGQLDTSGLTVNDPNIDPGLRMIHSRLLAWNDPVTTMTDVPGALLGGIDTKEVKACRYCAPGETPWHVFVRGNVILAQGFSQPGIPHFDDNTDSGVIGADYRFTPHFLAGVTASYAHTDVTLDTFASSATVDSYSPGVYASYSDGGWYGNFLGRYSYNSYTEQRSIAFLGQSANGATDGNEGMADLDGGYDFHLGAWTVGPVAGLQYTHLTVNGYNESGSDANLAVERDESDSLRSRLGGSVRFDFHSGGVVFSPHLTATWQHEFLDPSRGITSQFTNFAGGSFIVRTQNATDESALVDAGLDARVGKTVDVFADYLVQAGQDDYFGQSVQAGVRVNF